GRCTGAQFIAGPHRADASHKLHATKVYLKPLERLAIFEADPVPRLCPGNQDNMESSPTIDRSAKNRLALHPGSGSEQKNWPEANWAELVDFLIHSTQFELLLVGGEP